MTFGSGLYIYGTVHLNVGSGGSAIGDVIGGGVVASISSGGVISSATVDSGGVLNLFSTHPSMRERIRRLRAMHVSSGGWQVGTRDATFGTG